MSSKLDNFGGKTHVFSHEDRMKGARTKSWKKTLSARLNAMKNGKYAKGIKNCDDCKVSFKCPFKAKEPYQKCEMFSAKMIYTIMLARNLPTIEEFDKFISGFMKDYFNTYDKDEKLAQRSLYSFLEKLIEIRGAMKK